MANYTLNYTLTVDTDTTDITDTEVPLSRMWEEAPEEMQQVLDWLRRSIVLECRKREIRVRSPEDAAALLQDMAALEQEVMRVISLDAGNHVLSIDEIARGAADRVEARLAELFRPAIRHNATAIILAHNHPGGRLEPSSYDLAFTRRVVEAGRILDMVVLDHLIISREGFLSLAVKGMVDFS